MKNPLNPKKPLELSNIFGIKTSVDFLPKITLMNHNFISAYYITVNNFRMRLITHAASFGRAVFGVTSWK